MHVKFPLLVLLGSLIVPLAPGLRSGLVPVPAQPRRATAETGAGVVPSQLAEVAAKGRAEGLAALADEVSKQVEALRGWTFKQPIKKQLTSVEQMRQYLERQAAQSLPPGKLQLVQAFLRTIGLIPADADLKGTWMKLLESQVGGFYDPETKTMHLVAREGVPPFAERIMLSHELTHALDDQYVDLQAFTRRREPGTEDQDLTSESVVEGSATALMMQYTMREMTAGRMDQNALLQYAQQESERSKTFLDAPRYFSAMLGSYICGTQFLARGQLMTLMLAPDDKAVGEALLAARKDPPQSTEQILHPEKYWDAATRDEPVLIDDSAAEKWLASPGTWIVHADTVGEMLVAVLTTARGTAPNLLALQSSAAWTNAAATGWAGDRFYLTASGENADAARRSLSDLKGVWVTAWDTTRDRDEFVAAAPSGSLSSGAVAYAAGPSTAVVYFGVDESRRAALTAQLRETPLPMTKSGKRWTGLN